MSAQANAECLALWDARKLADVGPFCVPIKDGAWGIAGIRAIGGVDWGGVAVDPQRGLAIANIANMPTTMITVTKTDEGVKNNGGLRSASNVIRFADNGGRSCNGGRQGNGSPSAWHRARSRRRVPLGSVEEEYGSGAKDMGGDHHRPHPGDAWRCGVCGSVGRPLPCTDMRSGKLLWETGMAASTNAGAMTYMGRDGRQPAVGRGRRTGQCAAPPRENFLYHQTLVAFALPRPGDQAVDIVGPYPKYTLKAGKAWRWTDRAALR